MLLCKLCCWRSKQKECCDCSTKKARSKTLDKTKEWWCQTLQKFFLLHARYIIAQCVLEIQRSILKHIYNCKNQRILRKRTWAHHTFLYMWAELYWENNVQEVSPVGYYRRSFIPVWLPGEIAFRWRFDESDDDVRRLDGRCTGKKLVNNLHYFHVAL